MVSPSGQDCPQVPTEEPARSSLRVDSGFRVAPSAARSTLGASRCAGLLPWEAQFVFILEKSSRCRGFWVDRSAPLLPGSVSRGKSAVTLGCFSVHDASSPTG